MKKLLVGLLEVIAILSICCACKDNSSENVSSDAVDYLEVLEEGETVQGLNTENEDVIFAQIIDINDDDIKVNIFKKIIDDTAPADWYIEKTEELKTITASDDIQVWVMHNGQYIDSRIAYEDIKSYEIDKDIDKEFIWAFILNDNGKVKFIYEPLIP